MRASLRASPPGCFGLQRGEVSRVPADEPELFYAGNGRGLSSGVPKRESRGIARGIVAVVPQFSSVIDRKRKFLEHG